MAVMNMTLPFLQVTVILIKRGLIDNNHLSTTFVGLFNNLQLIITLIIMI